MDFNEVAVFIKVVQKGSFSGAALALNMPKSTVSTKVTGLEKRLGVTLLKRSTRKLQLTPAGEAYFKRVAVGIDEIMAAESELRAEASEPHGRFRLSAAVDLGNAVLCELISQFLTKYPKVSVELLLSDRYVDFLVDEIDLAIRAGDLKDSSLMAKKVGEVAFGIYASPKYLKTKGTPASPQELTKHDCILFSPYSAIEWRLNNQKKSVTVPLAGKVVVNEVHLVHKFAVAGKGIVLLPIYLCNPDVKNGRLKRILCDWRTTASPVHLVYPSQRFAHPAVKAFIDIATEPMRELLKEIQ